MRKKEPEQQKIIYGRKPVKEALEQGIAFEKIWLQRGISSRFEDEIKELAQKRHVAVQQVPSIKLEKLTRQKTHQGIAALSALIPYYEVDDILAMAYDSGFNSKTVFNTFFKKEEGITPRTYWKALGQ